MTYSVQMGNKSPQFKSTDMLPYIKAPKAESQVVLSSLYINVSVTGICAETTQLMTFYNPNDRPFSGELVFPLPEDAVVCGYALDIDGRMRDGVIVPKQEARRILDAEERKGADPGLVEQVQGNIYKIRVYPLPAKGTRTVSITYVTELTLKGNAASYQLPLHHVQDLDEVSIKVEVVQSPRVPQISGAQGNLSMTEWRDSWVAEAKLSKGLATEDLFIRLPDLPDELLMVEPLADDECYFVASIAEQAGGSPNKPWHAEHIAIAWDASVSRQFIDKDLAFLQALFNAWQNTRVYVSIFRNSLDESSYVFDITNGDAAELKSFLENVPYDGATDLSAVDFSTFPDNACEAWFLFTDAMETLNGGWMPTITDKKIYVINSQAKNNAALCQYLAEQSGGMSINLLQRSPEEGAERVIENVERPYIKQTRGCEDVFVKKSHGRVTISGKLIANTGQISLEKSAGNLIELKIDPQAGNGRSKGKPVSRIWAGHKISQLFITESPQSEDVMEIARRFGVVSQGSSLLVLEELEQYVEYGIEPPESESELRDQYRKIIRDDQELKKNQASEHLERVVQLWSNRIEWWQKEFDGKFKKDVDKVRYSRADRLSDLSESAADGEINPCMNLCASDEEHESLEDCIDEAPMAFGDPDLELLVNDDESNNENYEGRTATVTVTAWNPEQPYIESLQNASDSDLYMVYLAQKREYESSPSFFLDCGDFFLKQGHKQLGIRILSNLLEMGFEDVALMRIYGWRLQQEGELESAIAIFQRILDLRNDEPQSYRDLALVYGARWERDADETDLLKAIDLIYTVIKQEWDRFPEIELIALMELNRFIFHASNKSIEIPAYIDKRLIKNLDLDLRISLAWDADLTDVDLHVFEPTEEHAYYGHNLTVIGGLVSRDFTEGYGPEEYVLRKAIPGIYKIKAHYYGSHQQSLSGPCTVTATVFTNFSRTIERQQTMTLRLDKSGDDYLVGEVQIKGNQGRKYVDKEPMISEFRQLQAGMTVDEITKIVGQPKSIENEDKSGNLIMKYVLSDRSKMHVTIGPQLILVQQVMEGAIVDLVS